MTGEDFKVSNLPYSEIYKMNLLKTIYYYPSGMFDPWIFQVVIKVNILFMLLQKISSFFFFLKKKEFHMHLTQFNFSFMYVLEPTIQWSCACNICLYVYFTNNLQSLKLLTLQIIGIFKDVFLVVFLLEKLFWEQQQKFILLQKKLCGNNVFKFVIVY